MNRVVITGAGVISSLGMDLTTNFNSLSEGKNGIGPIDYPLELVDKYIILILIIIFQNKKTQFMTNLHNLHLLQLNRLFHLLV